MKTNEEIMQEILELLHIYGEDDTKTLETVRQDFDGVVLIDSISLGSNFIVDLDKHGYVSRIWACGDKDGYITISISR